jgi:CRP-like cAMP-binding protein
MDDVRPRSPNSLLATLSPADFELLSPHLRDVELVHKTFLAKSDDTIDRAYFPHSGVISLVMPLAGGEMIEVAMVGRDTMYGGSALLDGRLAMNDAIVQLPGRASAIDIISFRRAADQSASLRDAIARNEEFIFAQVQQSAACNGTHALEARLARWLLRVRDLASGDRLELTQEFLGQMLGVQRSSVSLVANTLQSAGLIRYRRGNIEILNVEGLKDSACECYATLKQREQRLLKRQG